MAIHCTNFLKLFHIFENFHDKMLDKKQIYSRVENFKQCSDTGEKLEIQKGKKEGTFNTTAQCFYIHYTCEVRIIPILQTSKQKLGKTTEHAPGHRV